MKKKTKGLSTNNSIKVLKIIQYTQTVRMLVSYPWEKQATINQRYPTKVIIEIHLLVA